MGTLDSHVNLYYDRIAQLCHVNDPNFNTYIPPKVGHYLLQYEH
jgi:hypothetical protein